MALSEAAKKARKIYMKEWRERNRDKQRAYAENKWERRAERMNLKEGEKKQNGTT